MEIIGGLAYLGNYINSRNEKKELEHNKKELEKNTKKSNNNNNRLIFNNNNVNKTTKKYKEFAMKRMKKNKDDSEFTDDETLYSNGYDNKSNNSISNDPNYLFNKSNAFMDNRNHERKFIDNIKDNNNFTTQFNSLKFDNPSVPVSSNAVPNMNCNDASIRRKEIERSLALNEGFSNFENADMTYGLTSKENFLHNNMQPYFKGKGGYNELMQDKMGEIGKRKVELYTGSNNRDDYKNRKEQTPLFDPITNMTNTFGNPVMTDFYESRYIPSKERRNEKLLQPKKVTPGLNLGYNEDAKFGNFDPTRILPKTIDEIRTKDKQQVTYTLPVTGGQKGSNGQIAPNVVKNKPLQFVEYGENDLQKNYSTSFAPSTRLNFNPETIATKNRGLIDKPNYGIALSTNNKLTPHEFKGKIKEPFKQTFEQSEPTNVKLNQSLVNRPNIISIVPKQTQRDNNLNYLGPTISNTNKNIAIDYTDVPNITQRNINNKYDRAGQTIGNGYKNTTVDYNDVPNTTQRNINDTYDRAGQTIGNGYKNATIDYNDVPDITQRNINDKYDRAGQTTGNGYKNTTIDYNNVPDITQRNINDKYDRAGQTTGNGYKNTTIDYNDVPDTTLREIINKYDRAGQTTGNGYKNTTNDYNDVPDITLREIFNKYDRAGQTTGNGYKNATIDYNDVPDITLREIINKYDRAGQTTGNGYKNTTIDYNDVPDTTLREIFNKYDRAGQTTGNGYKNTTIDYNDVPDITQRNINDKYDRAGQTIGNGYKNTTIDYNNVPDITQRNINDKYDRAGQTTGNGYKNTTIDYNNVPDITQRNINDKYDRAGQTTGNGYKNITIDYNDVPNITQRNINDKYDRAGQIMSNSTKPMAVDYKDVPNITQRNINDKYDRAGQIMSNNTKPMAVDYNDVPNATQRNINDEYDRAGQMQGNSYKNIVIDYNDVPETTIKETTIYKNRIGNVRNNMENPRPRDDVNNALLSEKEKLEKGRKPTLVSENKGYTNDFTEYTLPNSRGLPNNRINKGALPVSSDHIKNMSDKIIMDKFYFIDNKKNIDALENTLDTNPLINNVVHKAKKTKIKNTHMIENRILQKGKIIFY
jgi:hypothetical protein